MSQSDRLIRPGMTIVDLGASPGGWTQVAMQLVGKSGTVIASDILSMRPITGVKFIQGDFTEQFVYDAIVASLKGQQADLVISDMAPNMSGNPTIDQPRSMYLAELALDMSRNILKPGGAFLVKVFQGEGFDDLLRDTRSSFAKVQSRKPSASRGRSRELYQLAIGFRESLSSMNDKV
jgi:23S rRNA (uridine2552-2'-O)-methyltransferase